jgi:rhamnose utilization protein RhaD (predicted bifunctional aldolase and dehydrogenase)
MICATTSKRPKGKMGGANATPLPRAGGAAVAQAQFPQRARLTRMAQLKVELQEAAEDRARVQPEADAHAAALRSARSNLHASYAQHGMTDEPTIKAYRIKQHDMIVAASERWGKKAIAYRNINTAIKALVKELEQLSEENSK